MKSVLAFPFPFEESEDTEKESSMPKARLGRATNTSLADCKAYSLTAVLSTWWELVLHCLRPAGAGGVLGPAGLWVSLQGAHACPISSRAPPERTHSLLVSELNLPKSLQLNGR